jgi:hypothetical protein
VRRLADTAAALAVAATVALGALCLAGAARVPFAGFLTYQSGAVAGFYRAGWPGFAPGAAAVRDVVVAVDGEPVRGGAAAARAIAARAGGQVAVRLRAPSGSERELTLPVAQMSRADLAYTFVLPFCIGLLYLLLGAAIYVVKRDLPAGLALALCLVAASFYMSMFDAHTAYRFTPAWLAYPLLGPLSVHLFATFPERRPRVARPAVLAPLYLAGAAAVGVRIAVLDDARAADGASLASAVLLAGEFLLVLGLLATAARHARTPEGRARAKTTLAGMAPTVSVVVAWQFAARLRTGLTADEAMVASTLVPLLIAYALLRRNLFDVDRMLRASLIYGVATALVVGLYLAVVAALGALAAPHLGATLSTLVAAAAFHPLRLWVQRLVDRLLLVDRRAVAAELAELAGALRTGGAGAPLVDEVARMLLRLAGRASSRCCSPTGKMHACSPSPPRPANSPMAPSAPGCPRPRRARSGRTRGRCSPPTWWRRSRRAKARPPSRRSRRSAPSCWSRCGRTARWSPRPRSARAASARIATAIGARSRWPPRRSRSRSRTRRCSPSARPASGWPRSAPSRR